MFHLDAYLERVGLASRPDLATLHRAHVAAIPFENLDPHRGVPVSLEPADLQRKLVTERRGGYCFEHNLLLKAALEALGAEVEPMLARVRRGAPAGAVRPRSHLVLRVRAEGAVWLADVGFGAGTPLEPLPFEPGEVQQRSGWRFRLAEDGEELVLHSAVESGWEQLYGFIPRPVPLVDIETSNWFASTHPRSPLVGGLIASTQREDGTRIALSDWFGLELSEQTPAGTTETPLAREAIPGLLEFLFGLPGLALGPDGRVVHEDRQASPAAR
jgi:N-hydroxyarylamine O-acetyltransferase